jgi:cytosine/adenosine deaminase-related metal-dependent hydrolase
MRALRQNSFSTEQVLRSVTVVPARLFGVAEDLGTIQPGKLADLVMVNGDPFENFAAMVRTPMTMRGGIVRHSAELATYGRRLAAGDGDAHWREVGRAMRRDGCCPSEF